jgi:hypothetical protein
LIKDLADRSDPSASSIALPTPPEHMFRMDPFPFSLDAMPSLDPRLVSSYRGSTGDSSTVNPPTPDSGEVSPANVLQSSAPSRVASETNLRQSRDFSQSSGVAAQKEPAQQHWQEDQHIDPALTSAPPQQYYYSGQQQPVYQDPQQSYASYSNQTPHDTNYYPPLPGPLSFDMSGVPVYGEPYIFEPIPLAGDQRFDNLEPLADPLDPAALTALWVEISGDSPSNDAGAGSGADMSGLDYVSWNQDPLSSMDSWANLAGKSTYTTAATHFVIQNVKAGAKLTTRWRCNL